MGKIRKPNTWYYENDYAVVVLNHGQITKIDVSDLDRVLSRGCWGTKIVENKQYAKTSNETKITLHNFIFGKCKSGYEIDHINGDSLDNRKSNLREVTHKQNCENFTLRADSVTGIRGVTAGVTGSGKPRYKARVKHNYKEQLKSFPYTQQGLQDAEQWVIAKRSELFTHSDGR